ncbi:MAG: insulinase family protein [Clostridia bacterium]|nr:insulinase family protein [Clostridia bacterium]
MRKTETLTLSPGIALDYIPTDDYKNASFAVGFKYKVKRDRSSADMMLARLLFRTSADYPTHASFSRRLEELYSTDVSVQSMRIADFRVALFQTTYLDEPYVHAIPDFTHAVLSFVAGAILRPALDRNGRFPLDAIAQEKTALLDQIRSIKNSKPAYAYMRLAEITRDPRLYDVPDYGTEEEIEAITAETLHLRYVDMLSRSEIRFVYAGTLPIDTVAGYIRKLFSSILTPRRPLSGKISFPHRAAHRPILREIEKTDGEQAILGLSYRLPIGLGDPGTERLTMLSAVLSDAPMSLLFSEVREKSGYCYSIRSAVRLSNRNLFIFCGIEPGCERSVERAVSRVLTTVRTGKTDPALLMAALSYLRMTVASVWENVDAAANYVLMRRLFDRPIDPDELIELCGKVTESTLADLMKRVRPDAVYLLTPKGGDRCG